MSFSFWLIQVKAEFCAFLLTFVVWGYNFKTCEMKHEPAPASCWRIYNESWHRSQHVALFEVR